MSDEWQRLNQAYWDAWKALAEASGAPAERGTGGPAGMPAGPWTDALNQWWQAVSHQPHLADKTQPGAAAMEQMVEQSRQFFSFAEMMREAFRDDSDKAPLELFAEQLRDAIGSWRLANRTAEFATPFAQWPSAAPGMEPFANLFAGMFAPSGGSQARRRYSLRDDWDPKAMSSLFAEYHEKLNAVVEQQFRALNQAVDQFTQSAPTADQSKSEGALKEWYDTWIRCCDAALSELSSSEQYGEQFGGLINAYLKMQQLLWSSEDGEEPEFVTSATTDAINEELSRLGEEIAGVHDLIRDTTVPNLKAHVSQLTDEVHELREEIATLRGELGVLKKTRRGSASPQTSTKKRTKKKSAASRVTGKRAGSSGSAENTSAGAPKKGGGEAGAARGQQDSGDGDEDGFDISSITDS